MHKLRIDYADPATLLPNPWNSNVVSAENMEKLEASLERLDTFKPILVRETSKGLEIIGGRHRAQAASNKGIAEVPILNLGKISDDRAKEIGLADNERYGQDDPFLLAELLSGMENFHELPEFLPYTEHDLAEALKVGDIDLDTLDIPEDDEAPTAAKADKTPAPTHQILRFKVPLDDVDFISDLVEKTMKKHAFNSGDSLTNAGDALLYLLRESYA